jgi:hypothetical protein
MHPFKEVFYSSPSPLILGYKEVQSLSTKGISSQTAPGKYSRPIHHGEGRKGTNKRRKVARYNDKHTGG